MSERVRCYSGSIYAQEPVSFDWEGQEYAVARIEHMCLVLDLDSGRVTRQFVVVTSDRCRFRLAYDEAQDDWAIEPLEG